jgi:hypothetical protein
MDSSLESRTRFAPHKGRASPRLRPTAHDNAGYDGTTARVLGHQYGIALRPRTYGTLAAIEFPAASSTNNRQTLPLPT